MHCWKVAWESARKAAKFSCRFHDLRHTFISRLAESQASDSTVMALAGHVSKKMLDTYAHIQKNAKRAAIAALDSAQENPPLGLGVGTKVGTLEKLRETQ